MTSYRPDDLAGAIPAPVVTPVFQQGVIVSWNTGTATGQVDVAGSLYDDVAVVGQAESAVLAAGHTVLLLQQKSAYYILGRIMGGQ